MFRWLQLQYLRAKVSYQKFRIANEIIRTIGETKFHCTECDSITVKKNFYGVFLGGSPDKKSFIVGLFDPVECSFCGAKTWSILVFINNHPHYKTINEAWAVMVDNGETIRNVRYHK